MGLTLAVSDSGVMGHLAYWLGTATFDSAYLEGGEALTAANFGFSEVYQVSADIVSTIYGPGLCRAEYDVSRATLRLTGPQVVTTAMLDADTAETGVITDSDSAASAGVLLYVHVDADPGIAGAKIGHLEFVSPTNVDGYFEIQDTRKYGVNVQDNDLAATNGVVVRAIAAAGGLESTLPLSTGSLYIPCDGSPAGGNANVWIKVADTVTASTPSVYFDEDESEETNRTQAVVVDNGDETGVVLSRFTHPSQEIMSGTDCSLCVVRVFALGRR